MFREGQIGSGGLDGVDGEVGAGRGGEWRSEVRETRDKKSMCVYYKNIPLEKV